MPTGSPDPSRNCPCGSTLRRLSAWSKDVTRPPSNPLSCFRAVGGKVTVSSTNLIFSGSCMNWVARILNGIFKRFGSEFSLLFF